MPSGGACRLSIAVYIVALFCVTVTADCSGCNSSEYCSNNDCLTIDNCEPGQFETQAPTGTSNRECETCPIGSYCPATGSSFDAIACPSPEQSTSPVGSDDVDQCICTNEFFDAESTVPGPQCQAWRDPCPETQYASQQPSHTQDRVCSLCPTGSYCPGTPSDPDIVPCPDNSNTGSVTGASSVDACVCVENYFDSIAGNGVECDDWTPCEPGTHQTAAPSPTSQRECSACPVNHYCTGVSPFQPLVCPPSTTTNGQLSVESIQGCRCSGNNYDQDPGDGVDCKSHSTCDAGTYETASPTDARDRECSQCPAGSYCPGGPPFAKLKCPNNAESSAGAKTINECTCKSGFWDTAPATTAVTCQAWHTCDPGEFEHSAPSHNSDRECRPCLAGSYCPGTAGDDYPIVSCPTGSSSPVSSDAESDCICQGSQFDSDQGAGVTCSSWNDCPFGHYETDAPTALADRVCQACDLGHFCIDNNKFPCGSANKYAGATGLDECDTVSSGHFSVGQSASTRTGQQQCTAGWRCNSGIRQRCNAATNGEYQDETRQTQCKLCSTSCPPGTNVDTACTNTADRTCIDDIPPVISPPAGVRLQAAVDVYVQQQGVVTDSYDGGIPWSRVTISHTIDTSIVGTYEVNYSVRDAAGNIGRAVRTVEVYDEIAPFLSLRGDDYVLLEAGVDDTWQDPGAIAQDAVDGDLEDQIEVTGLAEVLQLLTDKAEGTVSMTYNVKDFSDNEASQVVRTVEVADLTNPIIVLNGLATVYVEATPLKQPYIDQGATAIDAVDPDIDVHISGEALVDSSIPGSYTIRFTATSSNSQPADPVERTVIVRDSTVPTLSLFGDAPVMLLEGGLQYDEPGAQAEDTFCPNEGLQVVITGADVIDSLAPVGTEYEVVYNVQDCSGLDAVTVVRTVRIVDTLRPVISANRPNNLTLYHEAGTPYADPGATALDKHDGVVTVLPLPEHVPVNTAPKDTPAVFEFNYTAVDGVGLQATPVTRTVIVRDTLAPTITLQGPLSLVHEAATDFDDPGFNASDVLDTIVVVTSNATADMVRPPSTPFDVVLEYTAQDKAGNRAVPVYRRVTVDDTTPPDVDLNGPANVIHEGALAYSDLGATSTDMLDGNLTRFVARDVFLVHESADGSPAVLVPVADVDPMLPSGTVFHVNYSVSDQAGNVESALRTVTLDDSTLPRIWLQVDPVVYVEGRSPRVSFDDVGVWPGATANDTLDLELTDTMVAVVRGPSVTGGMEVIDTSAPLGTEFEVTYSVSDAAGNAAQPVSRKVVVVDTVPPVISLVPDTNSTGTDPSRIVLVAQQPYFDAGAEAFDDYGGDVTGLVTVVGKDAIDNTVVGVSFNLTYLCNDTAGNAAMPVHRSVTFVQPKSSSSASSIATFAAAGGAPIFIILLVVLAVVFVRHRRRTNRGVGHGIKSSGSFVLPTVNGGVTDMTVMADCWTAGPAQFGSGEVAASTFQTDGGVFSVPMVEPTDAMTSPWFHGPIAREVAEERIRDAPGVQEGSFLVRQKGEEGTSFAISMMTSQRVMHYILKLTTEGVFVLWNKQVSKPCKASLAGSVEHLKTNRECLPSALTVGIDRPATSTEIGCRNSDTSTDMDVEEKEYSLLTVHRDDIPADTGLFVRAVSNGQVCFVQVDSCMPLPTVPLFVEMAGSGSKSSSLVQETSMYDLPDRQVHLYAQAVGPQGPVHVPIVTRTPLPEVPLFTIINSGSADQLFLPYDRPEEPPAQHHRGAAVLTLDGSGTLAADSSDADLDQYDSVDNALPNRRESLLLQHQQQDMYEVTLPSAAAAAAPSTAASPTTASPLPAALHTWFHGPITRKQASSRLAAAGGQDGVFLVRSKADKPHQYVVSLMFDGECVHFVLEHHQPPADGGGDGGGHGGFVLQGEPLDAAWASDLASVVEHLQQQAEGELPCALGAVTDNPHGPQPLPAAAQARNGATPPDTGNATPAVSVDTPDMYAPLTQDIEQLLQSAGVSHADDGTYAPITQDIGRLLAESGVELFVRDGASQDFSAAKEELLVGSEQLYAKFGSEPGGSGAGEATASAVADADADADAEVFNFTIYAKRTDAEIAAGSQVFDPVENVQQALDSGMQLYSKAIKPARRRQQAESEDTYVPVSVPGRKKQRKFGAQSAAAAKHNQPCAATGGFQIYAKVDKGTFEPVEPRPDVQIDPSDLYARVNKDGQEETYVPLNEMSLVMPGLYTPLPGGLSEEELDVQRWYHGCINRKEADKRLQGLSDGAFLLRKKPDKEGQYVLCVVQDSTTEHLALLTEQGGFSLQQRDLQGPWAVNVVSVIGHLRTVAEEPLSAPLGEPVLVPDYENTAPAPTKVLDENVYEVTADDVYAPLTQDVQALLGALGTDLFVRDPKSGTLVSTGSATGSVLYSELSEEGPTCLYAKVKKSDAAKHLGGPFAAYTKRGAGFVPVDGDASNTSSDEAEALYAAVSKGNQQVYVPWSLLMKQQLERQQQHPVGDSLYEAVDQETTYESVDMAGQQLYEPVTDGPSSPASATSSPPPTPGASGGGASGAKGNKSNKGIKGTSGNGVLDQLRSLPEALGAQQAVPPSNGINSRSASLSLHTTNKSATLGKRRNLTASEGDGSGTTPPWLHGILSRQHAEKRIKDAGHKPGMFLVRQKDRTAKAFAMSMVKGDKIVHHLIEKNKDGGFVLDRKDHVACTALEEVVAELRGRNGGLSATSPVPR
eukprot:m.399094 g.399094  ORF g.399094 m.399094 type:complete len:2697 (-) comp20111_c4_seq17:16-8106(-)